TEEAALFICRLDKEYTQGFRKIRYDRNSALPEGAECCEYRLRFDEKKNCSMAREPSGGRLWCSAFS
ncbi:MAG: hypothetical protein IKN57_03310, partial [Parasporobacterium sp.]|nr:hypothetical protein [Parasporobacterium sp.]